MKCDELTPIDLECNMGKDINGVEHREPWKAYDIDEVNAAIAELKQKIEDAKATAYAESVDAGMRERESEADKMIRHLKYKRCRAMASLSLEKRETYRAEYEEWCLKWYKRWLELAEQFKPNNEVNNA